MRKKDNIKTYLLICHLPRSNLTPLFLVCLHLLPPNSVRDWQMGPSSDDSHLSTAPYSLHPALFQLGYLHALPEVLTHGCWTWQHSEVVLLELAGSDCVRYQRNPETSPVT